jgi:PPOX class probable F420-dependent enzyme
MMIPLPGSFHDLLHEKKALAHLATLLPDGSPHVTPVWFDVCEGKIRVNIVRGRVKARNMLRDARVALSVADPDNPDRYIQIRGLVTRVTDDGAVMHNNALTRKYYGLDTYPWDKPGDVHVIFEIEPTAVHTLG